MAVLRWLLAGAPLLVALYVRYLRPGVLNWGATAGEAAARLPGDDLVANAALQTTRVISIGAGPEQVWPWIVQMGPRPRAGVYTYDWIERLLGLDIENSNRIMAEFQTLEPGEYVGLNDKQGLRVVDSRPEEALVLQWEPAGSSWAFVLQPEGDGTRLLSRNRLPGSGPLFWLMAAIMEPASLVMERKMLLGIKERAERQAAEAPA